MYVWFAYIFSFETINMAKLESKFHNESESVENGWLKEKTSNEISEALDEESSILQMIWSIENERMRDILEYVLKEKLRTKEEIKKEIEIYHSEVEPKLWNKEINRLFKGIISNKKILPSAILKEFRIREDILEEPDSETKILMEKSFGRLFPSKILEDKEIYQELAAVKNPDEREIILHYIEEWYTSRLVREEYESYKYIKNDTKKGVKSLAMAYIKKWNMPSEAILYLELFEKIAEKGEDTVNYILWLINEWENNYSVETLLSKAYLYKKEY